MRQQFQRLCACSLIWIGLTGQALAAGEIQIVGSSTVFPFTANVIEQFAAGYDTRFVGQPTGTTAGLEAFCMTAERGSPSISGASRPIKDSERSLCEQNGVTGILELMIGRDGIAIISAKSIEPHDFKREGIYRALAANAPVGGSLRPNPFRNWRDISLDLPLTPIDVYGPPETSGTRDAFEELALLSGAQQIPVFQKLAPADQKQAGTEIRRDGPYKPFGEDDNKIVNQVRDHEGAFGIVGFSYAFKFEGDVQTHKVEGIEVSIETIEDGTYPLSRDLYLYVKDQHFAWAPELIAFVEAYLSETAIGDDGYLSDIGLVPIKAADRETMRARLREATERQGS